MVRATLFRAKNLLALVGIGAGLLSLSWSVGALGAGHLVSTGVFALVGGSALYGAMTSYLGRPLRGVAVCLAALLLVGGGAYAAGVGPADTGSEDVVVDGPSESDGEQASERVPYPGYDPTDTDDTEDSSSSHDGFGYGCSGG